ncbi:PLC-like phosphodiesterase [Mycena belliarum]|uniref:PLC-like phosphodiesterase n=1 Tax=Mycena belliarum TaxID=1033014 RepID=A0AAD6UH39_9AGAR|nr:PLC-like phosphodiesterase [Mycena belliae]
MTTRMALLLLASSLLASVSAASQEPLARPFAFDVQGHRGGRGNAIENTLPAFAWGLIDGATTLELDNGVTKDGVVVVWHDEEIVAAKCQDTGPAFLADPTFPYVGKFIANLTLAQVKTLDCGSQRQDNFPFQLTYPATRISTMQEVFDFVECADPDHLIRWNIESKIDPAFPDRTRSVETFVNSQHALFAASPYRHSITYQSFDWRSLIAMKDLDPSVVTSALVEYDTTLMVGDAPSPWLAGLNLQNFSGSSLGERVASAAHHINATILSSSAYDSPRSMTTRDMVDRAHQLGMLVKPWTVNRLEIAEDLIRWGVDGIITDYPNVIRRWVQQQGLQVAPKYPKRRVLSCLERHSYNR